MKKLSKNFDLLSYFDNTGIRYWEHGKNVGRDYIGIQCPFCYDHSNHLGIHRIHKGYRCLICGVSGSLISLLKQLEDVDDFEYIKQLLQKYKEEYSLFAEEPTKKKKTKGRFRSRMRF